MGGPDFLYRGLFGVPFTTVTRFLRHVYLYMCHHHNKFTTVHHVNYIHSTPKGDDLVAYMARVSNPNNQNNTETSAKLINYLIRINIGHV